MRYRGTTIADVVCECTDVHIARMLVTAVSESVALAEASYLCGWSIITAAPIQGCVEGTVPPDRTPDGRPGVWIQMNAPTPLGLDAFLDALLDRLYLFPHLPTCSLFDATPTGKSIRSVDIAARVARWGDGHETAEKLGRRDIVRLPIMTGDQLIEREIGVCVGTDGVLEIFGENSTCCVAAAQEATRRVLSDAAGTAVFNYPIGGISGAKVGGIVYKEEGVTINEPFCPSLRDHPDVETHIPEAAAAVIEFPLVAISDEAIRNGLRVAINAFCSTPGIVGITAPSFGGQWGNRHLLLKDLIIT
ncbi:hypothetical protein JW848_03765 [Candidatus Bipolaricaulota bacterium]|nr:hypothetical protein [Candidatus Bipolaricaulota bacterium]